MASVNDQLGFITEGSLSAGLEMRLNPELSAEKLRVGTFAVIEGERNRYFAMLEDVRLKASDSAALISPPKGELARTVLQGTAYFTTATMRPMLMIDREASADDPDSFLPVKSIPPHFSQVHEASTEDIQRVFGSEERDKKYFELGRPLDMDTPICLNLDRWVERSNAIFGKSGTGKTFLTKLAQIGRAHV